MSSTSTKNSKDQNAAAASSELTPAYCFGLTVVRNPKTKKYLLVHECRDYRTDAERGWWLPGGRVEPGEDFIEGAIRECKEEAGIDVALRGVLRVEHSPHSEYARLRVIYYAEPTDADQAPKSVADSESIEARWVELEDLQALPQRGDEPTSWFTYLERGGRIYPLTTLTDETAAIKAGDSGPASLSKPVRHDVGSAHNGLPMSFECCVVVRDASRKHFLLVNGVDGLGWRLPHGALAAGETFAKCAKRVTRATTGADVTRAGVLRVEFTTTGHGKKATGVRR
jgi:ADP-ribose pyrophosphatase YjhB (NUDIX family)